MSPVARRLASGATSCTTARSLARALPSWAPRASDPARVAPARQWCCDRATAPPTTSAIRSPSPLLSHRRSYHSYDHPDPAGPFSPAERAILAAAEAHIPQQGFTPKTLALGAWDAGYLDISTNLLADGVFTLVRWHLVSQREGLARKATALFEGDAAQGLGMGAKVELLTWERLMGNRHVIGKLQEVSEQMSSTKGSAMSSVAW